MGNIGVIIYLHCLNLLFKCFQHGIPTGTCLYKLRFTCIIHRVLPPLLPVKYIQRFNLNVSKKKIYFSISNIKLGT